jgi:hypothetical protein
MAEPFGGMLIKLAVDVEREILAGGGGLQSDAEWALLEDGSRQEDIWGADWLPGGLNWIACLAQVIAGAWRSFWYRCIMAGGVLRRYGPVAPLRRLRG